MKEKCKGDLWKVRWSTPWLSYEKFIIDAEHTHEAVRINVVWKFQTQQTEFNSRI